MRVPVNSLEAQKKWDLLSLLQHFFVNKLQKLAAPSQFTSVEWLRDNGEHGGGLRFVALPGLFNRASINLSQVHFADQADKPLLSATALSAIVHPAHPLVPSMHLHISWSELKNGKSYWRIMADLNPAIADAQDKAQFDNQLKKLSGRYYDAAMQRGEQYFYIPAAQRYRGVSHFYLEGFNPEFNEQPFSAKAFTEGVISCYCGLIKRHLSASLPATAPQKALQLNYHTLYFYQVLTLDRGTTAGLLAHSQNDIGTLGSLPAHINRPLLESWIEKTAAPQDKLVKRLLNVLPTQDICEISDEIKAKIAEQIRIHYLQYPLR